MVQYGCVTGTDRHRVRFAAVAKSIFVQHKALKKSASYRVLQNRIARQGGYCEQTLEDQVFELDFVVSIVGPAVQTILRNGQNGLECRKQLCQKPALNREQGTYISQLHAFFRMNCQAQAVYLSGQADLLEQGKRLDQKLEWNASCIVAGQEPIQDVDCARVQGLDAPDALEGQLQRQVGVDEMTKQTRAVKDGLLDEVNGFLRCFEQSLQHCFQIHGDVVLALPDDDVEELDGLEASGLHPVAHVVQDAWHDLAGVLFEQFAASQVRSLVFDLKLRENLKLKVKRFASAILAGLTFRWIVFVCRLVQKVSLVLEILFVFLLIFHAHVPPERLGQLLDLQRFVHEPGEQEWNQAVPERVAIGKIQEPCAHELDDR